MTLSSPLVSIIIPTYNRAHLIGETLDSIISQTYKNWECIVVDDGSRDDTDQVMRIYCEKDFRFKYFQRPKEYLSGGNGARNYGFKLSKGDYIQWFDSDDLMAMGMLMKIIQPFIKNKKLDFVSFGFTVFNGKKIKYSKNLIEVENFLTGYLEKSIVLNLPTLIYNKRSIGELRFNEKLTRAQDLDFCFRFFINQDRNGVQVRESLVKVREHENQITTRLKEYKAADINSELLVRKNYVKYINKNYSTKYLKLSLYFYILALLNAIRSKNIIIFIKQLLSIWYISPWLMTKILGLGIINIFFNKGNHKMKMVYLKLKEA